MAFTHDHVELGVDVHHLTCTHIRTQRSQSTHTHIYLQEGVLLTAVVDNRQGGDSAVREDRQRSDERRVGVDVGDVGVRPDGELLQRLLHEGRHGHLTHLTHTHTHRVSVLQVNSTRAPPLSSQLTIKIRFIFPMID